MPHPLVGPLPVKTLYFKVHNPNANATGTYQQLVVFDSFAYKTQLNANLSNAAWNYTNGVPIPSWIESNASNLSGSTYFWLKMNNIGAGGSVVINLNIWAKADFLWGANGTRDGMAYDAGVYPEFTHTCGQWDSGARVFGFYDNFCAPTLNPANWTTSFASGGAATTGPGGLLLTGTSLATHVPQLSASAPYPIVTTGFQVWDFEGVIPDTTYPGFNWVLLGFTSGSNNFGSSPSVNCGNYDNGGNACLSTNTGNAGYGPSAMCLNAGGTNNGLWTFNSSTNGAGRAWDSVECDYGANGTGHLSNTAGSGQPYHVPVGR